MPTHAKLEDLVEPSFFSNNGMISVDECAAQCDAMPEGQCVAIGHCDELCPGTCHLYVKDDAPAPDGSVNWHLTEGKGDATTITRVTNETNWRCFTRRCVASFHIAHAPSFAKRSKLIPACNDTT